MGVSLCGLRGAVSWLTRPNYELVLIAAMLVGVGFLHLPSRDPLAWRAWPRAASAGLAQSVFQVGGNLGTSIGPSVLAAFIVLPFGRHSGMASFAR